jgi:hypothetical protein
MSAARAATTTRDLRLDFFRGLSLFFIFIDHIPDNGLSYVTLHAFSLADAAEVFIFISGYTAALVYGRAMLRDGVLLATARVWRRVWQLYVAHLCLFMIYMAEIVYSAHRFNNPLFVEDLGAGDFLTRPDETIVRVLLLAYQPTYLDILPLYIALLAIFPLVLLALRRGVLVALLPSFALYVAARWTGLNMPANEGDGWYFNPFAWQFLFVIAASLGYRRATDAAHLPAPPGLTAASVFIAVAGCVIQLSWTLHDAAPWVPTLLHQALWPVDKTTLAPLRLVNLLALAWLASRFVPREAPLLVSRFGWVVGLCGRNSLEVFCLSILMSVLGGVVFTLAGRGWAMTLVVNHTGIGAMLGFGLLMAWYDGAGRLPLRPAVRGR